MITDRTISPRSPDSVDHCFEPEPEPTSYTLLAHSGRQRTVGDGPPAFIVRLRDLSTWNDLLNAGAYRVATAFVRGEFDVEGDLIAAVRWWQAHRRNSAAEWAVRALGWLRLEAWFQTKRRARRNAQFHYDRSNLFYQQFLDRRMVYSCAYFAVPGCSLDEAQYAKLDYICRKLDLRPGDLFLDVGCGWGALLMHAAERYGARAVGCTLSAEQLAFVRRTAAERGIGDRIRVEGLDYRRVSGCFDRIASVGMYEHVGRRRLTGYFATLARLLQPDGLILNHGIARPQDAHDDCTTRFVQQYVFPGGELPYLAEIVRAAERAGLEVLDVENLRAHYALTCAAWVDRLTAHRDACLAFVDALTYRTWLLYLAAAAVSFERGQTELYQTLLAKRSPHARRRRTREYMYR